MANTRGAYKKIIFFFLSLFTFFSLVYAQPVNKAAADAYVITRMVQKFHVQPRALNDSLSNDFYNNFLKVLDGGKIFFTMEDIAKLQQYRLKLDEEISGKKTAFLQMVINLYGQRTSQADSIIDNICKQSFGFSSAEKYTVREDTSYPANAAGMRNKLYKLIKLSVLKSLIKSSDKISTLTAATQKKYLDSAEQSLRKKVQINFKRAVTTMMQSPGGLQQAVSDIYCESLATCYDPHTSYFPLTEKENFESELGNGDYEFGFSTDEEDEGGVSISNLKPGSPAFKSGLLNEGDKIISVQWEGKESIDVSDASEEALDKIFAASNHDKITLTVKKVDGTTRQVTMMKEKIEDSDDDNKVKSFLLKGEKTIGYISLPAFYEDWEDAEKDVNGCANDVAKEIVKLKKENIDGLVLDLRYNGGGSVQEATELAGIFIDAGPVSQIKNSNGKTFILKDISRGTIYDGPLMILVNGYSASASEMLAGTLQDYNRAVITGNPTYGKATAQIVLPMDTTINLETFDNSKKTSSYLKLTTDKLFRVSGATAQGYGVQPDILIPDESEAQPEHESDEQFWLHVTNIDANKYYKPYPPLPLTALKTIAANEIAKNDYFKKVNEYVQQYAQLSKQKDISLRWDDALQERKKRPAIFTNPDLLKDTTAAGFSIENNAYEKQRLANDAGLQEINNDLKDYMMQDATLKIAYDVLCAMAKMNGKGN